MNYNQVPKPFISQRIIPTPSIGMNFYTWATPIFDQGNHGRASSVRNSCSNQNLLLRVPKSQYLIQQRCQMMERKGVTKVNFRPISNLPLLCFRGARTNVSSICTFPVKRYVNNFLKPTTATRSVNAAMYVEIVSFVMGDPCGCGKSPPKS